jgi:hypothetical protein
MEANETYGVVASPFGDEEIGLLAPLRPDVTIVHAAVADRAGNLAMHPPLLEGVWGALGAERGVIATTERVVDDLQPWSHLVRVPAHRTLAVVEAPFGAHPGGLFPGSLPVEGYGEDYDFWVSVRDATRADDFDAWIGHWVLDVKTQDDWLERVGDERLAALRRKANPESWRDEVTAHPPDLDAPPNRWELAAAMGARYLAERIERTGAQGVLAGAGVANLSAWLGVQHARAAGCDVHLTAEVGLWDYDPVLADPFVLNHRNFPGSAMLGDASLVLGTLAGGAGTTTIACLGGAQVDRVGNVNSTQIPGGAFLVGSGGGNDVASVCADALVVALLSPERTPESCGYVTSPGRAVRAVVTDLGILEKLDEPLDGAELVLTAVPDGAGSVDERVTAARAACGWDLRVADTVRELPAVGDDEVAALRRWDPRGWFLRAR